MIPENPTNKKEALAKTKANFLLTVVAVVLGNVITHSCNEVRDAIFKTVDTQTTEQIKSQN